MSTLSQPTSSTPVQVLTPEAHDFSLVLGGPLYQLFRRAHLTGSALELLRRRIVFISLFAWLPLLILSIAEGHAWGREVAMPFLHDVDVHVRFLVALDATTGKVAWERKVEDWKTGYYMTLAQCQASVSGLGGFCKPSPWYDGKPVRTPEDGPPPRRRRRS